MHEGQVLVRPRELVGVNHPCHGRLLRLRLLLLLLRPSLLLAAGHFYNGFTWRLKLTVKPPDPGSSNDMNIHVGLCWGVEIEGEGPVPLAESAMVQV